MKYTKKNFEREFPNDDVCLDYIFNQRFGNDFECPKCYKIDSYYRVKKRKSYSCAWCANQVYPLNGTIFQKTSTPLTDWFYIIFLTSQAKNGISAKEIERQIGVTYKCAWRMAKQIRLLMVQSGSMLRGTVEADETAGKERTTREDEAQKIKPLYLVSLKEKEMLKLRRLLTLNLQQLCRLSERMCNLVLYS